MQEAHIAPTYGMLHLPPRQRCLAGAFEQSAPVPRWAQKSQTLWAGLA